MTTLGMRPFLQNNAGICYIISVVNAFMLHPQGRVLIFNSLKNYVETEVTTPAAKQAFTTRSNTCPTGHRKFEFYKAIYFAFKDAQNSSGRSQRSPYSLMKNLARSVRSQPNIGGHAGKVIQEVMNRLDINYNVYDATTNRPMRHEIANPDINIFVEPFPGGYTPDTVPETDRGLRLGGASIAFDYTGSTTGHVIAGVHYGTKWDIIDSDNHARPVQSCEWRVKRNLIRQIRNTRATNVRYSYLVYYKPRLPTTYDINTVTRLLNSGATNGFFATPRPPPVRFGQHTPAFGTVNVSSASTQIAPPPVRFGQPAFGTVPVWQPAFGTVRSGW